VKGRGIEKGSGEIVNVNASYSLFHHSVTGTCNPKPNATASGNAESGNGNGNGNSAREIGI
jgi:hypothetical protein